MKISQDQKSFDRTMKFLNKKRKQDIENRKNEIKNIKNFYDKAVKFTKIDGEKRLFNANLKTAEELDQSYNENLLDFERSKRILEEDINKVKMAYESEKELYLKKLLELNERFNDKVSKRENIAERALSKIDIAHREALVNLESKSGQELSNLETEALKNVKDHRLKNRLKIESQHNNFLRKLGEEGLMLDQNLKRSKVQNKEDMEDLRTIQEIKIQQTFRKYSDILITKKEHHKEKIDSEKKSFQKNFLHLKSTHKELLDRVEKIFYNQIEDLRKSHSKFKKTIENKLEDEFYQINLLNPRIEERGKEYFIYLKVPYHERETVHLTGRNRSIRLTLARRFEDRLSNDDGTFDHSKKSEVFSKTINTEDILDHNSITQKYEDGHLIFKIRKK